MSREALVFDCAAFIARGSLVNDPITDEVLAVCELVEFAIEELGEDGLSFLYCAHKTTIPLKETRALFRVIAEQRHEGIGVSVLLERFRKRPPR